LMTLSLESGTREDRRRSSRANPHGKSPTYVGDSHGIQHLIGAYWEYDDLRRGRAANL